MFWDGVISGSIVGFLIVVSELFNAPVWSDVWSDFPNLIRILLAGGIGTLSAWLVIEAVHRAPASKVAPFGYLEIVSAVIIGFLFFNELPNVMTIFGLVTIVASCLYISLLKMNVEVGTWNVGK